MKKQSVLSVIRLTIINVIIITTLIIGSFIMQANIWGTIVEPNFNVAIIYLGILGLLFGIFLWLERMWQKENIVQAPIYILGAIEIIIIIIYIWGLSNQNISSLYYYIMFIIPLSIFILIIKNNIHILGLFIIHFLITIWVISNMLK